MILKPNQSSTTTTFIVIIISISYLSLLFYDIKFTEKKMNFPISEIMNNYEMGNFISYKIQSNDDEFCTQDGDVLNNSLLFTLSPRKPMQKKYDQENKISYFTILTCYGVTLKFFDNQSLSGQYNNDKAIFSCNPIVPNPPDILPANWRSHSGAHIKFLSNTETSNRYKFTFTLYGEDLAEAAFYLNKKLVKLQSIDGQKKISITVNETLTNDWIDIHILLVQRGEWTSSYLELRKIECYNIT